MSVKAGGIGINQDEMESLVRRILVGRDLSKTTGKIVRQKVIEELGERAGPDMRALKHSVRDALSTVLKGPQKEIQEARPGASTSKSKELTTENGKPVDGTTHPQALKAEHAAEDTQDHDADTGAVEKENIRENEDSSEGIPSPGPVAPTNRKRRTRIVVNDDEDDDVDGDFNPSDGGVDDGTNSNDFDPDSESINPRSKPAEKESPSSFRNRSSVSEPKRALSKRTDSPASSVRAAKRSRSTSFTEKRLERLRGICRQLGCMAPPARMRGKTVTEKCEAVLDYLRTKGIRDLDPTSLTRKEIAAHRARLEQEKELAGLDTSNIIEDGRRSRRNRATVLPNPAKIAELPSDVSGAEMSESSDNEDSDEYEIDGADSE